jgi:hypothetical protein
MKGSRVHSRAVKVRHLVAAVAGFALLASACSSSDGAETTTAAPTTAAPATTIAPTTAAPTTATTSTTAVPTTTTTSTTAVPLPASPLNGLGVPDELQANLDRRVLAVKIDNHPDARPQSGLQEADAVIELLVEAGLTRFIALFLVADSDYVGPIRSLRPTDPTVVKPLGATMQISGGQAWVRSFVRSTGVPYLGETSPNTFRIPRNGRAYERTLYGTTDGMRQRADRLGTDDDGPAPWFTFGEPTPSTESAETITLRWSSNATSEWQFDGERYLRFGDGAPHNWRDVDGNEDQVAFDTLLVLEARQYTARPSGGQSGKPVPALDTVGSGDATLFYGGGALPATWQRDTMEEPFDLRLADGTPVVLPPGRLWVSVFPDAGSLSWE